MKKNGRRSGAISTVFLLVALLLGVGLLSYPSVSDYVNSVNQSKAIVEYAQNISTISDEEYEQMWAEAIDYNQRILLRENIYVLSDADREAYNHLLSVEGDRVIGYVDVPVANALLPVFRGTEESSLQRGAGHLEWTSLPTGGIGTHAVLSSHRGLPSALLFTHLNRLVEGDTFTLHILNKVLTYEVDQILVVEPIDTEALLITPDQDYCTLVTCTPYGVNSHRLLVRGHRVANAEEEKVVRIVSEAIQIKPGIVAATIAIPMILALLVYVIILDSYKGKTGRAKENVRQELGLNRLSAARSRPLQGNETER